jgi:hypothetical protein
MDISLRYLIKGGVMDENKPQLADSYRILVKEKIDQKVFNWFGNLSITYVENMGTLLTGSFADQPALRGFLDQLWNLNITVISVERVQDES